MNNTLPQLAEITQRIKAAASAGATLRIRGGGTKDFYGQSLQGEILDTTGLNGITSYEPSELVVTVKAGTPLAELEAALAEKNQCLPFEPPHFSTGTTVGGMVAAGLSGPSRASSGSVKDFVLGVNMVNGKGEELHFGGTVMKNVAGYDVSRLMAGSMGTLGLITEVSLKVLPVAPAEATLKFECTQADAINMLNTWGAQPLPLNASCWIQEVGQGVLYVRLRGAVAAVEAAIKKMGGNERGEYAGVLQNAASGNATVAADWQALRHQAMDFFKLQGGECLWRLSVPDTAPDLQLGDTLVEWHGAQRWVKLPYSEVSRIRSQVNDLGGGAILFIVNEAINTTAREVFSPLKAPLDRIHRELKKQFDPAGIFNRGRMFADM